MNIYQNFMARNHIYTRESIVEGPTNGNPFSVFFLCKNTKEDYVRQKEEKMS